RFPPGRPHRVQTATERRLRPRRVPPHRLSRRLRTREARRRSCVRAPSEDTRELARAERAGLARRGDPRARGDRPRASDARGGARPAGVPRARRGIDVNRGVAAAKLNLALVVGPQRSDGKHELATVYQRIALADDIEVRRAERTSVEGFAADTLVARALAELTADGDAKLAARLETRIPVAAGLGGGSADA